jgi:GST-like protein
MMKLYGYDTINTLKVLIIQMETDVEFDFIPVNIRAGEQHTSDFLTINPARKVPVLSDGDQHQTQSNAILLSLAKRTGWGLPNDTSEYNQLIAWLFYQASTQGPHFGQVEYWSGHASSPNPEALAHYRSLASRSIEYFNAQMEGKHFIGGDNYTIADIALFP